MVFTDDLCGPRNDRVAPIIVAQRGQTQGSECGRVPQRLLRQDVQRARAGPGTGVQFCEPE